MTIREKVLVEMPLHVGEWKCVKKSTQEKG